MGESKGRVVLQRVEVMIIFFTFSTTVCSFIVMPACASPSLNP